MIKSAIGTYFIFCPWNEDCELDRLCTRNVCVSSRMTGCSIPLGTTGIQATTSTAVLELLLELELLQELEPFQELVPLQELEPFQELVLGWEQAGPVMR